jgi:hypothetical protein
MSSLYRQLVVLCGGSKQTESNPMLIRVNAGQHHARSFISPRQLHLR